MTTKQPSLVFEGVWKRFRKGQLHDSLRDLIPATFRRMTGREPKRPADDRYFWAVRDLSFDVKPGDVLGIIGGNGAGKSTTLKILNRIMEPSAGIVKVNGTIGALIEVSAGFHPDLTGRQNIFLQGAIMGMRKAEVMRKFDEIVDFSGIPEFIDTPVKRYSSGMNARLGFAIAAHLEPDILIIDEVLSVGDARFQQKAFARIKQMASAGAPVVLVSHQLDRISELCTKAILLERGEVRATGSPLNCINAYLHGMSGRGQGTGEPSVEFQRVLASDGQVVRSGEEVTITVAGTASLDNPPPGWVPALCVVDQRTGRNVHSISGLQRDIPLPVEGEFEYEIVLQMNVPPGTYHVMPFVWDSLKRQDIMTGPRLQIEVLERSPFYGDVQMNSRWRAIKLGARTSVSPDTKRQTA
ncbi:MAG TPA: polysaccharide ABC transporter ATP-binding protein [Gemmatimonadaceae bacterium]|nr:polysaccharide ABC transporter ATP-binding protein [Gemmatimonadaceae bacterium]